MAAGQYFISAFFDYTGDFFATFKFRNLPEATDIGGGYIDINDATKLVPNGTGRETLADGGTTTRSSRGSPDPNYQPIFLPVNIGTPGARPCRRRSAVCRASRCPRTVSWRTTSR